MINDPLFVRHKEALSADLEQQVHRTIEHKTFENHVTSMAMEARINRDDIAFLLEHVGQGPAPPPPPSLNTAGTQTFADNHMGTQTEKVGRGAGTQTEMEAEQIPVGRQPPPPPAGAAAVIQTSYSAAAAVAPPLIQSPSPEIVEKARTEAELDAWAQEEAKRAAMPGLRRQISAILERERRSTPHQQMIAAAQQLREVPKAPAVKAEVAYVAPSVQVPTVTVEPFAQYHGVAPTLKATIRSLQANQHAPPPASHPDSTPCPQTSNSGGNGQ